MVLWVCLCARYCGYICVQGIVGTFVGKVLWDEFVRVCYMYGLQFQCSSYYEVLLNT